MNLVERLLEQAAVRPEALALRHRGRAWSFRELEARTARGAAFLRGQGLGAGDPVLIFVPMGLDLYEVLLSVLRIGAVAVFLDPSAGKEHVAKCCARIPPKGYLGTPKAQVLRWWVPALRKIPRRIVTARYWPFAIPFGSGEGQDDHLETRADGDAALITFTSGSTGEPKAAVRSHGFLLTQHEVLARTLQHAPGLLDLATLPVFVLANLASGQGTLIPDADLRSPGRIAPGPVLDEIREHRPATCAASPAFFERLAEGAEARGQSLDTFRALYTGGAPVFPGLLKRLQLLAPQAEVVAVYGSTEAEPIAEMPFSEMSEADLAAMAAGRGLLAGPPVEPEIRLRIIKDAWGTPLGSMDAAGFDALRCPAGEVGEIVVAGGHVLKGYLEGRGDEETKFKVDGEVWHRTGDAGRLDGQGRVWLLGRCSARIRDPKGELFPFAVETAALQVPGVRRAALAAHKGRRVLVVEGAAEPGAVQAGLAWAGLDAVHTVKRIPLDRRHNAKVDYPGLLTLLERLER
ncbi:MAG: AMP-binding protein [Holophagaceae bacterium]|nr:AMP-binding protein [Holophagaceae bacterium]